jgi:quercetin dioxygenase-like cupin family protein
MGSRFPLAMERAVKSTVVLIATVAVAGSAVLLRARPIDALREDKPVPVEEEPLHKVELKNDWVAVMRLILPPGEYTRYHVHTHDRVAIPLSATSTTQQEWKKSEGTPNSVKPGDFSAMTLQGDSYAHRVHNVGKQPYEVLDIEFVQRPATPSPDLAGPVAAENPSARIYNWVLAPSASAPMHKHVRPYVMVSVTALNLQMSSPDGQTAARGVEGGGFRYVDVPPGGSLTHNLVNIGPTPGQIVEVELK